LLFLALLLSASPFSSFFSSLSSFLFSFMFTFVSDKKSEKGMVSLEAVALRLHLNLCAAANDVGLGERVPDRAPGETVVAPPFVRLAEPTGGREPGQQPGGEFGQQQQRRRRATPRPLRGLRWLAIVNSLVFFVTLVVLHASTGPRPVWDKKLRFSALVQEKQRDNKIGDEGFDLSGPRNWRRGPGVPLMHSVIETFVATGGHATRPRDLLGDNIATSSAHGDDNKTEPAVPILRQEVHERWDPSQNFSCLWRSLGPRWQELQASQVLKIRVASPRTHVRSTPSPPPPPPSLPLQNNPTESEPADSPEHWSDNLRWLFLGEGDNEREGGATGAERVSSLFDPSYIPWIDPTQVDVTYYFSLDKGLLFVSPETRRRHNVSVISVTVRPNDPCLGAFPMRFLQVLALGYETYFVNDLLDIFGPRGYVRSAQDGALLYLSDALEEHDDTLETGVTHLFRGGLAPPIELNFTYFSDAEITATAMDWSELADDAYFRVESILWVIGTAIFSLGVVVGLVTIVVRDVNRRALELSSFMFQLGLQIRQLRLFHPTQANWRQLRNMNLGRAAVLGSAKYFVLVFVMVAVAVVVSDLLNDPTLGVLFIGLVWIAGMFDIAFLLRFIAVPDNRTWCCVCSKTCSCWCPAARGSLPTGSQDSSGCRPPSSLSTI
jgi:hypothetical protein